MTKHGIISLFLGLGLLLLFCISFSAQAQAVEYASVKAGSAALPASPSNTPDLGDSSGGIDHSPPDLIGGIVTRFGYERVFSSLKPESFRNDELFLLYNLMDYIDNALDCTIKLPDGSNVASACTAVWNDGELPLNTAGIYQVTATLIPPEGCVLGDGVRTQIILPVQIIDPELSDIRIISVEEWVFGRIAIAVPKDSPIEAVIGHTDLQDLRLSCTDENGNEHTGVRVDWDFASVDMDTPGLYTVNGTLVPPPGTVFDGRLTLPQPAFTVSVQIPGQPQIDSHYRGRQEIRFPWLLTREQTNQTDSFEVWMSTGGTWFKLNDLYHFGSDYLAVALSVFPVGQVCRIQVDYPGGQTGIAAITYDGTKLDCDYSQGDRDGGDTSGRQPPDDKEENEGTMDTGGVRDDRGAGNAGDTTVPPEGEDLPPAQLFQTESQPEAATSLPFSFPSEKTAALPLPQVSSATSDKSRQSAFGKPNPSGGEQAAPVTEEVPVSERFGETYSILSGARLLMMAEDSGRAEFSKQGVMVSISKEALETLEITDKDGFFITIRRINRNRFSFSVMLNGATVNNLAKTRIMLPYDREAPEDLPVLQLAEDGGYIVSADSFDPLTGIAAFTVDTAGTFTILEERSKNDMPAYGNSGAASPLSPTAAGGLLFLGLVGAYLLKRRVEK